MKRPWILTIGALFMLMGIFLTSEKALAQATVSGTVSQIDAASITITKDSGGSMRGQAGPAMLKGIKVGDKVSLSMAGPRVTAISKK